jgi:hypothetical protein
VRGEAAQRGVLDAGADGLLEHLSHHARRESQAVSGLAAAHGAAASSS